MKKRVLTKKITACGVAAALAFAPALGNLVLPSFAAEEESDVSDDGAEDIPEEEATDDAWSGSDDGATDTPAEDTSSSDGSFDDGSGNTDDGSVSGDAGDGSGVGGAEPVEASGSAGDGSAYDDGSGSAGDGASYDNASEGAGDGSSYDDVPGKAGDTSSYDGVPGKAGDGSLAAGTDAAVSPVTESVSNSVSTDNAEPEKDDETGSRASSVITDDEDDTNADEDDEDLEDEDTDDEEEEDEEDSEEDGEDDEEEEDEEEDEETEDDEEEEDEEDSEEDETGEVLTPEQQAALDDEDAVQAEQAFDYYEAYSPEMFAYQNYWRGWKQGQSAWYSMRNYGCRMVAYSKLLRASGVVKPGNFSPDDFFLWCRNNGWLLGTIREIGTPGNCMIDYAASKGYTMIREESISMFKSADPEERKQEIIDKINEGYYVILCSSAHFVYVDDLRTRITQELWVDDSINGENIYKVDRYVFQGSLADWENADARKNWHYRCFKPEVAEDAFEEDDEYAAPRVLSAEVSAYDEESGVYTIEAKVNKQPYNLDRVMFPTWADNDHKDLPANWEYGTGFNGTRGRADAGEGYSVWTFDVNLNDHDNVTGNYYTYIYVYDKYGNRSAPFTLTVTVE